MTTCGMYDSAGEWVVDVGMPAKSGVAGGILAVLPGQLGIAVYSPPLDPHGNSVRGIEVCRQISDDLDLNLLHVARSSRSAVRRSYTVADIPSRRRRPDEQGQVLAQVGSRCVVHVLHGDLVFAATESVIRALVEQCAEIDLAIVDLAEVTEIDVAAARLLAALGAWMAESGKELVLVAPAHGDLLGDLPEGSRVFADLDARPSGARSGCSPRTGRQRRPPHGYRWRTTGSPAVSTRRCWPGSRRSCGRARSAPARRSSPRATRPTRSSSWSRER